MRDDIDLIIVGSDGIGKTISDIISEHHSDRGIVIVHKDELDNINSNHVYVNGEKYEEKPRLLKSNSPLLFEDYHNSYKRKLPDDIDIIKEYEFIIRKESKLTKWMRDEVVRIFNSKYNKVL